MEASTIAMTISAIGTVALAAITFYIEVIKPRIKKPKLEIKLQRRNKQYPYIHTRDVVNEEGQTSQRDLPGGRREYRKAREMELDVTNNGKTPAYNCEGKCEVQKDGKIQPIEPLLLYWSRKLPFARRDPGEPKPITINRNDREELRFLRLEFWSEYGTEELWQRHGVDIVGLSIDGFRRCNIQRGHEYTIKITVFSENAEPASKRFRVEWDGSFLIDRCIEEANDG